MADTVLVTSGRRTGIPSPEGNPKTKRIFTRGTGALVQNPFGPNGHETLVPVAPWGAIRLHLKISRAGVLNLTWCDGFGNPMGIKVIAAGLGTFTGLPANGETMTLGTKVYTMETVLTNVDGNVLIGATVEEMIDNIVAAVTLGQTPAGVGSGTAYAAAMTLCDDVTARKGSATTLIPSAKSGGVSGNALATTETMANFSFGAGTMAGGIDGNITVDETAIVANTALELDIPGAHAAAPEHVGEPYLKVSVSEMAGDADVAWFDAMGASW